MKQTSLFLMFLFLISIGFAQPVDPSKYASPIKVACIGNSITYGSGISDRPRDSYPSQLARMLGEKWEVRNFGVGGRTLLKKGDNPYWKEEAYSQAKAFLPDVVVIKMGTNDSKPQNWKFSSEFYTDYLAMVTELKNLPSHPRIYLCKPVPAYGNRWGINDSIIVHEVIPVIEKIAKKEKLTVIDLYSALSTKSDLFPDQIHPNAEGAGLMAKTIYKALTGNEGILVQAQYPGKPIDWHGFTKYDFQIDRRNARIVIPDKAATGKPWVWRARFPDWHYQMDSILIRKGFHVVYIDTDELLGSPGCVEIWNNFYNYLITQYGLNKKVALEGVSRGGLYVFNFAKKYPERIACIYAEAPVCDFKSWPGGKGAGKGDAESWKLLIKAYNFKTEQEALNYKDNPIENLENLAAAKVPLLFQIGLHDSIVPPDENTYILANKYIRLGGPAMIYPNTLGKQSLQWHHFPIDDVKCSADFIRNSYPEINPKLDSRNYHTMRSKLHNAQMIFEREKKGRVAFLGGSITAMNGWRDSICVYLQKHFPDTKFDFIAAGIPSFGSTPGAFRFERDVLKNGKVDLLFEEAAVNDRVNGFGPETQILGMEGIVRHARESNPAMDIVIMHFVDPDKMAEYRKGITPPEIQNHEKVAAHYGISTINLAKEVTERIDNGEFTWENDFKNLHPSPFGQHIYYQSMKTFLETCWSGFVADDDKLTAYPLPAKLNEASYTKGILIPAVNAKLVKGWQAIHNWTPTDKTGTRDDFTNVSMLVAETPGETLKFDFEGNAVGIAVASGLDAGMVEFRIDKGDWKKQDLYTQWSSQLHLPWFYTMGYGLKEGSHRLEISVLPEKNIQSKGTACRIRYFYVNK
ncbi:xylanase [Aquipluma nitroreducens]|uniref:Xylanase n=1 Tax=Aquipluma nitroreducens TaxID=2010828 RepID=A0A5K7SD01_9BACT|nr:GDSL-type esterase/lipase family protein [Aquipluma nitroreducens]BBE19482.1 xylanase [Aquipluma nitroreducens]